MYCWVAPVLIVAVTGVTKMLDKVVGGGGGGGGAVTVSVPEPTLLSNVALITALPEDTPMARPVAAPTVAMAGDADTQAELVVTLRVEPSEYFAVAVNCCLAPTRTVAVAGATDTLTSAAGEIPRMGSRPASLPPPQAVSIEASKTPAAQNSIRVLFMMLMLFPSRLDASMVLLDAYYGRLQSNKVFANVHNSWILEIDFFETTVTAIILLET